MTQAVQAHSTAACAPPKAPGIYQIRNLLDGKVYVGSAINLFKRRTQHFADLRAGRHFNRHLQAAWRRDGEVSFAFEVLEFCDKAATLVREQAFIDQLKAAVPATGYNTRARAESNLGHKFSAETVEKNRRARVGVKQSAEWVRNRMAGRRQAREARGGPTDAERVHQLRLRDMKVGRPRPDIATWASQAFRRFDDEQLKAIRAAYAGGESMQALANHHGCALSTIHRAVKGVGPAYQRGGISPRSPGRGD